MVPKAHACLVALSLLAAGCPPPARAAESPGGRGPDVLGLRVGMRPDEFREVMKANVLTSPVLQKNYLEAFQTLAYNLDFKDHEIPGTKFLAGARTYGKDADGAARTMYVVFTPEPGHEVLVSLRRTESLSQGQRPTYETYRKALEEKYGPPTVTDPQFPSLLRWYFDSTGTVVKRKPGFSKTMEATACLQAQQMVQASPWILSQLPRIQDYTKLPTRCGAYYLGIALGFEGGGYAGPQSIVNSATADLIGYDAAIRSFNAATAIEDAAKAADIRSRTSNGEKQKPKL